MAYQFVGAVLTGAQHIGAEGRLRLAAASVSLGLGADGVRACGLPDDVLAALATLASLEVSGEVLRDAS